MEITHMRARSAEGHVNVFVEIPRGSRNKYEYDKELGVIRLDRALYSAMHYPTDYGFVPGTRSADGELIDALLMVEESTFPGCLVQARIIGVLTISRLAAMYSSVLVGLMYFVDSLRAKGSRHTSQPVI